MNHHPADDTLHRLVDGDLSPREAAALERHIAGCDECRRSADRLERLRRAVARLPREVDPPAELWESLRAKLPEVAQQGAGESEPPLAAPPAHGRLAFRPVVRWLAAGALVAASVGVAVVIGRGGRSPERPVPEPSSEARLTADLMAELEARRRFMSPETIAAVEENIRLIDAAITATQEALAADPDNVHLEAMLVRSRTQQIEYVHGTLGLASEL